ncbi:MAG: peptide ABC transporter substrate-binding protein [Clostridiales bacterium]|jgi:oligopeptide transport system substrate-binding protein|nr:peptide ABC transporter substrate-binding protein [Clostridiales bacterium]
MKKLTKICAFALTVVLSLSVLAACGEGGGGGGNTQSEDPGNASSVTASGNTTRMIFNLTAVATLDPALNNAVDGFVVLANMFEGLQRLDENDLPVPGVAETTDISDDGLTYTFHLRNNAKWSDGKPVTANDFVYAWRRAASGELAADYAFLFFYVKNGEAYFDGTVPAEELGVKALDDYTVQVELENPTPFFLSLCAFPAFYPVREDVVSADPDRWTFDPSTFISNGMYKIVENNDKVNYLLVKNENYWNPSVVKLAELDIRQVEDSNSAYASFQAGEFDGVYNVPIAEVGPGVEAGIVQIHPYIGTYFFCFNLDYDKASEISLPGAIALQDPRVRKALLLAIDKTAITDNIMKDGSEPAYSYVPPALGNSDGTSFAQTEYYNPKGDVALAQQLLAEAGFPNGENFPTLTYTYNAGASHEVIAQALQMEWEKNLGITVELKNMEWAAFQEARNGHDYLIARHGWIGDYLDPSTFLDMWMTKSGQNDAAFYNDEYDSLLNQARAVSDLAERDKLLHQAEDILMEALPVAPIYYYVNRFGFKPYVKGMRISALGAIYFDQVVLE